MYNYSANGDEEKTTLLVESGTLEDLASGSDTHGNNSHPLALPDSDEMLRYAPRRCCSLIQERVEMNYFISVEFQPESGPGPLASQSKPTHTFSGRMKERGPWHTNFLAAFLTSYISKNS